ncbi:LysR family transcriptional regulator [Enterococcus sp. AZ196]|uniref:LysR family transcriptional regulator n=1 Tax=Enterococcus sp. AZ196 TaxID=2774659 RepID=UPI003D2E668A
MELKNLITFKTIVETGSFQNASFQLNYAQSTVTNQIQQLENEFNVKLFEKVGRQMMLTQAGKDLIPHINSIIDTMSLIKNYHNRDNTKLEGELRIALPESLLTYQLQPILKKFHQEAPNVKLHLRTMNCYQIPSEVHSGIVDLGVYYDVEERIPNLIINKIWKHSVVLIGSPQLDTTKIDFSKPNQTIDSCLLTNDPDSIFQKRLNRYLKKMNINFSHSMNIGSIETIKRSTQSNLGIAILPRFVVEKELTANDIKEIPINFSKGQTQIETIYAFHKNKWMSPSMKLFINLLENEKADEEFI